MSVELCSGSFFPSIVKEMRNSEFTFYLTGSRFWGNYNYQSDWDFFTQDSPEVRTWLKKFNFVEYSNDTHYSSDDQCLSVYNFKGSSEPFDHIHIQVVADVEIKKIIQAILIELFPLGFKTKNDAKAIWKAAFACHRVGTGQLL